MPVHRARRTLLLFAAVAAAASLAGCSAEGASTGNFSLKPQKVGWYVGEEARFTLALESSFFRSDPSFTIDRHFAIEEIKFEEDKFTFGGDYETRDPEAVKLRLARDNRTADEFHLSAESPSIDVFVTLPEGLRDSTYTLSLKLFEVGWVESSTFRVDHR